MQVCNFSGYQDPASISKWQLHKHPPLLLCWVYYYRMRVITGAWSMHVYTRNLPLLVIAVVRCFERLLVVWLQFDWENARGDGAADGWEKVSPMDCGERMTKQVDMMLAAYPNSTTKYSKCHASV